MKCATYVNNVDDYTFNKYKYYAKTVKT